MTNAVLVTGCSTGFGLAISLQLAKQGFKVYATMRDLSRRSGLDAAAAKHNVDLRVLRLDVTEQASIDDAVNTIISECGSIWGVVNNAGQMLRGYFEDLTDAEIRQLFDTNFFGTLAVTRSVLPHMRTAQQGRIVIISSVAGKIGSPSGSVYSASRFAQEGFAESLRQEAEPFDVFVSLVEPGITNTESWTIDKGAAAGARDPNSPYHSWFIRAEKLFDKAMQTSPITTEDIADAVHRAMSDKRPRLRYMVGRRARLVVGLRRYIPGDLFERIYFREVMRRVAGSTQ